MLQTLLWIGEILRVLPCCSVRCSVVLAGSTHVSQPPTTTWAPGTRHCNPCCTVASSSPEPAEPPQPHTGLERKKHCYRFFCRAEKFFLKVGLIWLSSSTKEWLRKLGFAGLGLKLYAVDLQEKKKKQSQTIVIPETFHTLGTRNMTASSLYMHSIKGCTMCPCLQNGRPWSKEADLLSLSAWNRQ